MKEKEKFLKPVAELIMFQNEDIITSSGDPDYWDEGGDIGAGQGGNVPH